MAAAQSGFMRAAKDEGLVQSLWLLTQIIEAADGPNFSQALRNAGLTVPDNPTLFDIVGAFSGTVDNHLFEQAARTDVGEMAQMAAVETLSSMVGQETRSLFGTTPADVQNAFQKFSSSKQFSDLGREFFSRFARRYLGYFLSRELSNHVGGEERRFANIEKHTGFMEGLKQHCFEASRIVGEFCGGWFSKTRFFEGGISREKAAGFAYVALKKLREELLRRSGTGYE